MERDSSRSQVTSKAQIVITMILDKMSDDAKDALLDRLRSLLVEDAKLLAEEKARAAALEMRRRLSHDLDAANVIVGLSSGQRYAFLDDEKAKAVRIIHGALAKAVMKVPKAADIVTMSPDDAKKAARLLAAVWKELQSAIQWETFDAAVAALSSIEKDLRTAEAEKVSQDKANEEKKKGELTTSRINRIIKASMDSGRGKDAAHVKCTMVLPNGREAIGLTGWKDKPGAAIHPAVKDLLGDVASKGERDPDRCAEIDALTKLLNTNYPTITTWDQIPTGITSRAFEWSTYRGKEGWVPKLACRNCSQWLAKIKADFNGT